MVGLVNSTGTKKSTEGSRKIIEKLKAFFASLFTAESVGKKPTPEPVFQPASEELCQIKVTKYENFKTNG